MLRTPGLLALFTAKLLSTFGSWLTLLALPWFVLVTTGSPVKMSLVLTAEFVGVVTVGLVSGKLAGFIGSVAAGPALQFAGPRTVFTTIAILACAGAAMFVKGLRDRITRPAPLGRHLPAQSTAERT
ncbi:hypothetical protein [Actinoplanes regularis]|uniref:hypothetical protein n=1 Tax=Actinoplanes regularis TaxID=52697 RepID=UPI0025542D72|nr:hypothetical protein [Actinoplanes regularis]GLW27742.1 hypothetical protein Areg01_06820 [Actinoplanes regularis]